MRTRFCVTHEPNLRRLSVWRKVTCKCKHWIIFNTLLKVVHSSQFPLVNPGNTTRKKTLVCQKVEGGGTRSPAGLEVWYTRASFWNFSSWCYHCNLIVKRKSKIQTSFKSLVSKSARACRLKRPQSKTFVKKCLVITWNKKHLLKQLATITYTLEKRFFAVATFEGL